MPFLIPTKKQWKIWSLPSKLTCVGAYLGALSLFISIAFYFYPIIFSLKNGTEKRVSIISILNRRDKISLLGLLYDKTPCDNRSVTGDCPHLASLAVRQETLFFLAKLDPNKTDKPSLDNLDLRGGDLRGINLSGFSLRFSNFSGANLTGCNFSNSDLTGAKLDDAILNHSILTGVILKNATLKRAQLHPRPGNGMGRAFGTPVGVALTRADLRGADLSFAALPYAILCSSYLASVKLKSTHLERADFRYARVGEYLNPYPANLDEAFLENTICPDGTLSSANGGTCMNNVGWPK